MLYLYLVALVDEEGNLDLSAGLEGGGLGGVGRGVAGEAGVGLGDLGIQLKSFLQYAKRAQPVSKLCPPFRR